MINFAIKSTAPQQAQSENRTQTPKSTNQQHKFTIKLDGALL